MNTVLRVSSLAALAALAGCKTVANEGRERAPNAAGSALLHADAGATDASMVVDAGPPIETPLAWGTRPSTTGALYPVVDGMCIHGEIWPLASGGALYTYGNGNGPWTRGSETTYARLVDDGIDTGGAIDVAAPGPKPEIRDGLHTLAPVTVTGSWPGAVIAYGNEQGNGRMREYQSLWAHGEAGWTPLASWRDAKNPDIAAPVIFQGNAITWLRFFTEHSDTLEDTSTFKAISLAKGTAPLNVASLSLPNLSPSALATDDASLYVLGTMPMGADKFESMLLVWNDGKVRRVSLPAGENRFVGTRPAVVIKGDAAVLRLEGNAAVALPFAKGKKLDAIAEAPNGDVWAVPSARKSVLVVRAKSTQLEELPLPPPRAPGAHENVQHWPSSGGPLAGVEVDDPWVIGEGGSLYHLENGAFHEVELPAPPFAATGKYQAQALLVPRPGDVFVNAGYAEKGVGWKTVERYRAVLRSKRPHEVLRCTEPSGGATYGSGGGFVSSPPIATPACTTPFVILLRVAYGVGTKGEAWSYDRKTDYPSVREAIKATPALGDAIDLVETVSGTQRFLGAAVPNVAAGKELAEAVAKRVRSFNETRPEIVCGTPTAARTLRVEVATGKLAR